MLYVPAARGRPVLHRYLELSGDGGEPVAAEQLDFDEDAWQLAFDGGNPMVFREPGGWFVENPFSPPAEFWLVLPLKTAGHLLGAVIASRAEPVNLDPLTATLLAAARRAARLRPRHRAPARGAAGAPRSSTSACAWPRRSTTASPRTSRWRCASSRTWSPRRRRTTPTRAASGCARP